MWSAVGIDTVPLGGHILLLHSVSPNLVVNSSYTEYTHRLSVLGVDLSGESTIVEIDRDTVDDRLELLVVVPVRIEDGA